MSRSLLLWLVPLLVACGTASPPQHARAPSTPSKPKEVPLPQSSCPGPSAAERSPELIASVLIKGSVRLPLGRLCDLLKTTPGTALEPLRIQADIRALWSTGEIDDVLVTAESSLKGKTVTFDIRERPLVKTWVLEGMKNLEEGKVRGWLGPTGGAYNPAVLMSTLARLRNEYFTLGYRSVDIEHRSEAVGEGKVEVHLLVKEGPKATIKTFRFQGVSKGKEAELRALVETGEGRFNTVGAPYRAESLERDRLMMAGYYYDRGMVMASVRREQVTLEEEGKALSLLIEVEEGPVYRVGKIAIEGELVAPPAKYLELLGIKTGQVFSRKQVAEGLDKIRVLQKTRQLSEEVDVRTEVEAKTKTVQLRIVLKK